MKDIKFKLIFIFLLLVVLVLLVKQCGAEDFVDTLWVDTLKQSDLNNWGVFHIDSAAYQCVNETVLNTTDYIYLGSVPTPARFGWTCVVIDTTGKTLDSIKTCCVAQYAGGSGGTAKIRIGKVKTLETQWQNCTYAVGDTFTLTSSWATYCTSIKTGESCSGYGWGWYNALGLPRGDKVGTAPVVDNLSIRTGFPPPSNRVAWVYRVVYSHGEEVEGNKSGGIIKEDDERGIIK